MKITALEVDGYGVWSGLKLGDLSDGLNVFYGPNEAGKTTLMQFVRSVLYGFSPRRRRYLPPLRGGRPGGSVYVVGPNGRFQVSRHDNEAEPGGRDLVTLSGADGTRQGEHLLKVLLSNVDEATFNNVFAVGLDELQELGTLSDTEAASLLYNLSVGLDRVSLVEVVGELEASRKRLLDPDGSPCQVTQLLAEREKLRAELEGFGTMTRRYGHLAAEHEQTEREAARLEKESNELRQHVQVIEIAAKLRDRWQQRIELDNQLAAMGPAAAMPEGAVKRLDAINARLEKHQGRLEGLKRRGKEIQAEAAGLKVNESFWRLAPRIEALQEQEEWIGNLQSRMAELEEEIADLEARFKAEQQRFGLEGDGRTAVLPSLSSSSLAGLRPPARGLRECRQRLEQARQEAAAAKETAQALANQIRGTLAGRGEQDLAASMDRAAARVAELRRLVQIDQRLDQMSRYQDDLETQSRELLNRQLLPAWVLIGLGGVFVLGVVLLMAGLFMPGSITGSLGWPLALLGLMGTLAAVATKFTLERSNARRLDACQRQISMLQVQIKQAKQERDGLDEQLARVGGSVASRLEAAEKDLAALEELVPLDARRQAAEHEAEAAAQRIGQAESELASAGGRWREALRSAGLPEKLSPKQVRSLVSGGEELAEIQRRLELRYEEFQQRSRELDALTARIAGIAADTGLSVDGDHLVDQLRGLARQLEEEQSRFARREELRVEARRLRSRRSRHKEAISRLKRRRRELLRMVGVEEEEEFRRLAVQLARCAVLRRERETLQREIDAAVGGHCTEEDVRRELEAGRGNELEARREELERRRRATDAELGKRFERRGQLSAQLKALAEDGRPAAKQLELAVVEKRLEEAIFRWRTVAVTSRILDGIRTSYERDRQPETLQEASKYLRRLTEDRYVRVWTPLGEDVLLVDDAEGRSLPVELLSRGAREQLFVCLRLALAGCYARRGAQLPLVLDDVLVNFDGQRAKAAAGLLRDFAAAGQQLLVFTCHEHILKLFKRLQVEVMCLPSNEEADVAVGAPRKPARKQRRRKPRPEASPEEPAPLEPVADSSAQGVVGEILPADDAEADAREPEPLDEVAPWEEESETEEEAIDGLEDEEDEYEDEEGSVDDYEDDWDDRYEDEYDEQDEDDFDDAEAA